MRSGIVSSLSSNHHPDCSAFVPPSPRDCSPPAALTGNRQLRYSQLGTRYVRMPVHPRAYCLPSRIPHRHPDPRIRRPVVQEPPALERNQRLSKRRPFLVLSRLLVILRWTNEWLVQTANQPDRIPGIEQRLTAGINALRQSGRAELAAVAGIVHEDDPALRQDRRRTRLHQPGIEVTRARREHL